MVVGICKLDLHIPGCRSLKEKRQVLRMIKDRTSNKFCVPLAEVGGGDMWQRSELGFAAVGNDRTVIESLLQRITNFIENLSVARVIDRYIEIINV